MGTQRKRSICLFDGCDKFNFARGYCAGHAAQIRRGNPLTPLRQPRPTPTEGYAWCSTCKRFMPEEDFGWDTTRNAPKRLCKPCAARGAREWLDRNKEKVRLKVTLRTWGLTEERYLALFETQNHRCAICGSLKREKALCIDHDHRSGLIRGLVCQDCNMGMGQFADDPGLLERAAAYLRAGGIVHDPSLRIPENSPHLKRSQERDAKRARRDG